MDDLLDIPAVTVEIGFDDGGTRQSLGTAYNDVVWTDVTSYVLAESGVTFNRGRAEAGQQAAAGQLTVTFANTDGRFTPGTTGGPYGRVRTRMPIRVRGYTIAGATAVTLWLGFITDIDWQVRSGVPMVAMSASDIIAAAARTKCGPWLTKRVLATSAGQVHYWPLTDTAPNSLTNDTATPVPALAGETARALTGALPLTVVGGSGTLSFNVSSDVSPDVVEPVFAYTPDTGVGKALVAPIDVSTDLALSMWVRPTDTTGVELFNGVVNLALSAVMVYTDSGGTIVARGPYDGTGGYVTFGSLTADVWSHLYLQRDHDQTAPELRYRLWVNGVERTGTPSGSTTVDTFTSVTGIVGGSSGYFGGAQGAYNGQVAHVALWNTLDDTRAVFLANKGGAGATTCADRIAELHYLTPNPAGLSSWLSADATAGNTVSPQTSNGKSLLQVAEEVADAERGSIIATRDGKLRLLAQRYFIAPAAVSVTLSAESDIMALDNTFGVDDSANLNECAVTLQPSGWRYTATRTDDPGVESTVIDIWSADQYFAQSLAGQIANADTERPRAPSLVMSMQWLTVAGLADLVLSLELGDTIRVTDLPSAAPAATITLQVRLISHAITAAGWQITVDTDPPIYGAVLDDTDRGLLGSTTFLGV